MIERLTEPCDQRWADLEPRGEGRHCRRCDTTVVDLSRLTRRAAEARAKAGGCFRMRLDAEGAPVFRPDPVRLGLKALAMAASLAGCSAPAPRVEGSEQAAIEAPMEPVAVSDPAPVAEPAPELAPSEVIVPPSEARPPTGEQRALTRRKRGPSVPRLHERLGGMPPSDGFF